MTITNGKRNSNIIVEITKGEKENISDNRWSYHIKVRKNNGNSYQSLGS